jgi:signal transduction histidine kinase
VNAYSDLSDILASFLEALPWPALLVSEQGVVTFANRALRQAGRTAGVAAGAPFEQIYPGYCRVLKGDPPWLTSQDADAVRGESGTHEHLCVRRLPIGACIIILEQPWRELDPGGAQTARLASLGFMVAGVCHEVANPLTAIHSMVQLLQSSHPLPPEMLERGLENIASNVKRVLTIARKLNDFSRTGSDNRILLPVDQPVLEALQNMRHDALFRDIEIEHIPAEGIWIIGDAGQLEQVFANIYTNAAQAMGGRGRISVAARRAPAGCVTISVRDSGPGIDPLHLPSLFEPFFTTKPAGRGTGLGLAISNEIVLEHGGSVRAENHPAGGACFHVTLPLHERRV